MPVKTRTADTVGIRENMRVSLEIQLKNDINGMKNSITLSTVIEEILEDRRLLIHMPIHQGYHYPLPLDTPILMYFSVDSEMYAAPVRFEEHMDRGGFLFARIRRIGKITPHQRRDCYRLPCSLPVMVERLWQHERARHSEQPSTAGQIINFSDGGMLFAIDENIEKGDKITLSFDMGKPETIEGMALRTERIEDGKYLFRVAVQFKNTDKVQKDRLYKYIIDKQLEERRRWTQNIQAMYADGKENGNEGGD